ncbi:MAG: NAD-dependent epimerase/dehydratase family protein [Dehalococcoidia bacterium]|nr:NAD-dependent epimerase/dehydratase family protein [Dehalococcoidia bacterium]
MRVLVTGGAGFIGSHLCEALLARGDRVVCLDNFSTGKRENLSAHSGLGVVEGDVRDGTLVRRIMGTGVDLIFHYAATVGVRRTAEAARQTLQDAEAARVVADAALAAGKPKIVFASSSEVYGEPVEIPEVESGHTNAKIPYAVSKLYCEALFRAYWEETGLPAVSLRFFNVYGPRQESSDYGFVVGIFIRQVLQGAAPTVYGDGSQTRDFVYVSDNVAAALAAAETPQANGLVINVGTGRPTTLVHLAEDIIRLAGREGDLQPSFIPQPDRPDIRHRFPDVALLHRLLKVRAQVRLEEGLRRTIDWYRSWLAAPSPAAAAIQEGMRVGGPAR